MEWSVSQARYVDRCAALVQRERKTRFAGGVLAPLWAFITPGIWIAFVVAFFLILERQPPIAVGVTVFAATGILPYAAFRQVTGSMMRALVAHRHMRMFAPLGNRDILSATALVEAANLVIISLFVFGGLTLLFDAALPADLGGVYIALGLTWILAAGVGALLSVLAALSDSFARIVPVVMRPLFWISGLFYTATELAGPVQDLLWWNPVFHCVELLREGFFLGYRSPIAEAWVPAAFGAFCLLGALLLEGRARGAVRGRNRL